MSFTLGHKADSIEDEYLIEIVRKLGQIIASLGFANPDDGVLQFSASMYNHGNRTQSEDLLEEIIERLGIVGDNIGGGGGPSTDEKLKVSANDTTAKYLQEALSLASEVGLEIIDEGADETLKILAVLASAAGVKARVGNIPLVEAIAKLTIRAEAAQSPIDVQDSGGVSRLSINPSGNLVVFPQTGNDGGIFVKNDGKIYAGNNSLGDARIRVTNGGDIFIYSGTSKFKFMDSLHFGNIPLIDNVGVTVLRFVGGNSYSVDNALQCQTGISFTKTSLTTHIAFRLDGVINSNGQGTGGSGRILFQNNGASKFEIDASGNLIYHTPQQTGFANAAAVQAAVMPVGTIAQLTDGTLVRKI